MNNVKAMVERYRNLPKIPLANKIRYVIWKGLFRKLTQDRVVDGSGMLISSRAIKPHRPKPRSTFETIVSVNGFAWSGSSAVSDLLQEYKNVTSSFGGTLDDEAEKRNSLRFEFDLVRGAGGVYALEHAFETSNIFERDASIRAFMSLAYYSYVNVRGFYGDDFIEVTRKFVKRLLASEAKSPTGFDYCRHLSGLGTRSANFILGHDENDPYQYVYYLKELTPMEYRAIAAEYIRDVLNLVESDKFLVMDQGCADGSSDVKRFRDYFGPLKMIYVWRDPRDVYSASSAARGCVGFIPEKPVEFVAWYKRGIGCFDGVKDDNLLLVRFEDLVMDYDRVVAEIEQFLGLNPSDHIAQKKYFTPSMSYDWSVGRWQFDPDQEGIKYIESQLPQYCWQKPYVRPEGPRCDHAIDSEDRFEPGHDPLKG